MPISVSEQCQSNCDQVNQANQAIQSGEDKANKRKIIVLSLLAYGSFWNSVSYSVIAPFFPKEAEDKG